MRLLSLPQETLVHVVSHLGNRSTETLAQAYNKILTPICIKALSTWRVTIRNERRMIEIFGDPKPWETMDDEESGPCSKLYSSRGHELGLGTFSVPSNEPVKRLYALDYLLLNGDLHWLQPVDARSAARALKTWTGRGLQPAPAASSEKMDALQHACDVLGLTLPPHFARFMMSLELQLRVPAKERIFILDSPPLIKLHSRGNSAIDGYPCSMFGD